MIEAGLTPRAVVDEATIGGEPPLLDRVTAPRAPLTIASVDLKVIEGLTIKHSR